jgi:hypothetical protein
MDEEPQDRTAGEMPAVSPILRGQRWVELHGTFNPEQLRGLADKIEVNCKGLERGN